MGTVSYGALIAEEHATLAWDKVLTAKDGITGGVSDV